MSELEDYLMGKESEVTGTYLMPISEQSRHRTPSPTKTIRKTGELLQSNEDGTKGKQVEKLPQAKVINVVDVTGKEAPTAPTVKESQYALPSFSRYPLDNYVQVKTASDYFNEQYKQMEPEIRREFCRNLVKRANALGISVSPEARKYGSETYAVDGQIESCLDMRVGVIKEASHHLVLDQLRESRHLLDPDSFALAVSEFDKEAGLVDLYDRDVPDPYWTTFGEKRAEDSDAILVGNDYISHHELKRFALTSADKLKETFGCDFVEEFRKDPISITKSLPVDQKRMVVRLASSSLTNPTTT